MGVTRHAACCDDVWCPALQGVVEQITINSLPVGRSVDEALRLLQAIQFVAEHGEVRRRWWWWWWWWGWWWWCMGVVLQDSERLWRKWL
jgi:hypothetical protein